MKETKTATVPSIPFEQWVNDFKPLVNPISPSGSEDPYRFDIHDPAIKQARPETVWTLLDCDGLLILAHGWHYVNREAYYITTVPHEENSPEVEFWSHDDELDLILDTFPDRFEVIIDENKSKLRFLEGGEEAENVPIGEDRSVTFQIGLFNFSGKLNSLFDSLTFQGLKKDNTQTAQKRILVVNG